MRFSSMIGSWITSIVGLTGLCVTEIRRRHMRKSANMVILFSVFSFFVAGCATAPVEIPAISQNMRANVFTEVTRESMPPRGFADLVIKACIKTPPERHSILWWINDLHGKADYPFLFNMDGQAVTWKADKVIDETSQSCENAPDNPECGAGVKYVLEKRIRLSVGSHAVSFNLPAEDYSMQVEISVSEGKKNILEFKPIYNKRFKGATRNFLFGLKQYDVSYNGKKI